MNWPGREHTKDGTPIISVPAEANGKIHSNGPKQALGEAVLARQRSKCVIYPPIPLHNNGNRPPQSNTMPRTTERQDVPSAINGVRLGTPPPTITLPTQIARTCRQRLASLQKQGLGASSQAKWFSHVFYNTDYTPQAAHEAHPPLSRIHSHNTEEVDVTLHLDRTTGRPIGDDCELHTQAHWPPWPVVLHAPRLRNASPKSGDKVYVTGLSAHLDADYKDSKRAKSRAEHISTHDCREARDLMDADDKWESHTLSKYLQRMEPGHTRGRYRCHNPSGKQPIRWTAPPYARPLAELCTAKYLVLLTPTAHVLALCQDERRPYEFHWETVLSTCYSFPLEQQTRLSCTTIGVEQGLHYTLTISRATVSSPYTKLARTSHHGRASRSSPRARHGGDQNRADYLGTRPDHTMDQNTKKTADDINATGGTTELANPDKNNRLRSRSSSTSTSRGRNGVRGQHVAVVRLHLAESASRSGPVCIDVSMQDAPESLGLPSNALHDSLADTGAQMCKQQYHEVPTQQQLMAANQQPYEPVLTAPYNAETLSHHQQQSSKSHLGDQPPAHRPCAVTQQQKHDATRDTASMQPPTTVLPADNRPSVDVHLTPGNGRHFNNVFQARTSTSIPPIPLAVPQVVRRRVQPDQREQVAGCDPSPHGDNDDNGKNDGDSIMPSKQKSTSNTLGPRREKVMDASPSPRRPTQNTNLITAHDGKRHKARKRSSVAHTAGGVGDPQ